MKRVPAFSAEVAALAALRSRRWFAIGASALIASCASKPVSETGETRATPTQLVSADVDVVCRDEMVTGSHFPRRVCRSQKEWDQIEDASQAFTRGLQSDSTRNLTPVGRGVNPTPIGGSPVY
jgi:hypothetical protein